MGIAAVCQRIETIGDLESRACDAVQSPQRPYYRRRQSAERIFSRTTGEGAYRYTETVFDVALAWSASHCLIDSLVLLSPVR